MTEKITPEITQINFKFDHEFAGKFRKFSLITGILLMLIGFTGAIAPQIMSLVVSAFVGWLLLLGGVLTGYTAFLGKGRSMIAFLKPVLLFITGAMFLFFPLAGLAALALLLTVYLLMDAFGGFGLAYDIYPMRGWGWMAFNGVTSLILAIVLFLGWPLTSPLMIGLLVGISLFFDGLALLVLGLVSKKISNQK